MNSRFLKKTGHVAAVIMGLFMFVFFSASAYAGEDTVIVSIGDSYSSGEGIEKFYGQDDPLEEKVQNVDWLAHRSQKSWPGRLKDPNGNAMKKGENWYFVATSGATTWDLKHPKTKKYRKITGEYYKAALSPGYSLKKLDKYLLKGEKEIPAQLDIFKELEKKGKKADYVTITIGGNDLGFSTIMKTAATECSFLKSKGKQTKLEAMLENSWEAFTVDSPDETSIREDIKEAYADIEKAAGKQAKIIVAGYPKLLEERETRLADTLFCTREAEAINTKVHDFNVELEKLVEECAKSGMNITFVPVEPAFEGKGAYSKKPAVGNVEILKGNDLDDKASPPVSDYSFHPNKKGAEIYRECVQKKIKKPESKKSEEKTTKEEYQTVSLASPYLRTCIADHYYWTNENWDALYCAESADAAGRKLADVDGNVLMSIAADSGRVFVSSGGDILEIRLSDGRQIVHEGKSGASIAGFYNDQIYYGVWDYEKNWPDYYVYDLRRQQTSVADVAEDREWSLIWTGSYGKYMLGNGGRTEGYNGPIVIRDLDSGKTKKIAFGYFPATINADGVYYIKLCEDASEASGDWWVAGYELRKCKYDGSSDHLIKRIDVPYKCEALYPDAFYYYDNDARDWDNNECEMFRYDLQSGRTDSFWYSPGDE